MAATINQARTSIAKMFNGEPRSYTRFNLAQNTDVDSSQVEMKLSTDNDDEIGNPEEGHARVTYTQTPLRTYKKICYLVLGILLAFILGYLVGYISPHKPAVTPCSTLVPEESQDEGFEVPPIPTLDWSDITNLLEKKLSQQAFSDKLSEFTFPRGKTHDAGSDGDSELANKVLTVFKNSNMLTWSDEHFVKLPRPSSDNTTKVFFGDEEIGTPKGFLAYSEVGNQTGRVVYANYGTQDDLSYFDKNVDIGGSVLLLRAGQISFAEKVANAAKKGVVAVLVYPDPSDYEFQGSTELYGHVHLGSGDPYTPGFPSFEHTQFPPARSSGLPDILAQTITADVALKIFQRMGGEDAPSRFQGKLRGLSVYKLGSAADNVTVSVNNVLEETSIHNVFGVIKGNEEPDRYVVIGAQRDSWGPGFAKSTVGTTLLVELARAISEMVRKDHLSLRRSLVFASWSAGEYGSIGATEWQEGYLSSLNLRAFTYINLDGVITGRQRFKASSSPLLYDLLKNTLKQVKSPFNYAHTLAHDYAGTDWETSVLETMNTNDAAYPFMAFSGIPSISFRFCGVEEYPYFGTDLDTTDHLQASTSRKTEELAVAAAQVAGQMALRLAHDHLLPLNVERYRTVIRKQVVEVNACIQQLKQVPGLDSTLAGVLSVQWLNSAYGSYGRAVSNLQTTIDNSDLEDKEMRRIINDRIIKVEHNLLSPYVSAREVPFRHIIFGSGDHTMQALLDHLTALKQKSQESDADLFRNQFALATWTIQSCANDLSGPVWEMNNEI